MQVWVKRHHIDGVFLFTADDPVSRGLCVADINEDTAEQNARKQLLQILYEQGFFVIDHNLIMRYLLPGQVKP